MTPKVPARTSKQLPPSTNEISNKPFRRLLWVQKQTMMAKPRQTLPSSVAQPQRSRAVLKGQHSPPWPRHGAARPAPGRENWSNWTGESLPLRLALANRQPHGWQTRFGSKERGGEGRVGEEEMKEVMENLFLLKRAEEQDGFQLEEQAPHLPAKAGVPSALGHITSPSTSKRSTMNGCCCMCETTTYTVTDNSTSLLSEEQKIQLCIALG
ncbi:hypothetical protein EK904_012405 [Melospiza melodia maxima]|nr:hypothetical protein EK904_012405 [Melospiza melodia maxima]